MHETFMRIRPVRLRSFAMLSGIWAGSLVCAGVFAQAEGARSEEPAGEDVLRVCSDADNLPLANQRGEGYENKIAEQLAHDLGRRLEYTYFPQRTGFVRNTLRLKDPETQQFKCDVIIGVPTGYELTATTRPYLRSTYAIVFPDRPEFASIQTAEDLLKLPAETLRTLKIGVFGRSPGADWLLRNELLDRAVFYAPQSGDPHENPALIIERDLSAGKIDFAIVWGPVAGYLVRAHDASPAWRAATFSSDANIKFDYEMSMGVRFGEKEWKETLDRWIAAHQPQLKEIFTTFRVPQLDESGKVTTGFSAREQLRGDGSHEQVPLQLQSDSKSP